jgi:hypothetical protein
MIRFKLFRLSGGFCAEWWVVRSGLTSANRQGQNTAMLCNYDDDDDDESTACK